MSFKEALAKWQAAKAQADARVLDYEHAFSQAVLAAGGSNAEQRKANVMMDEGAARTKREMMEAQAAEQSAKIELEMAGKMHVIQKMQEAGITALPH